MIELKIDDKLFMKSAEVFNSALRFLKEQCVEELIMCEDAPGTTAEHLIGTLDVLCHCFLRRTINISEQYEDAINDKEVLLASLVGRALIETVAHFHNLLEEVLKNTENGSFDQLYHLIASYSLGGNHGFLDGVQFKKLHISDSIRKTDKKYVNLQNEYNFLSEFVHPNSLGTTMAYSEYDAQNKKWTFLDKPSFEDSLSPATDAILALPPFVIEWKRLPEIREKIIKTWKPSQTIFDRFYRK